jgi:hypothetical protein
LEHEHLIGIIIVGLADRAKEMFLYEGLETETEDEVALDEDLDDLETDLE